MVKAEQVTGDDFGEGDETLSPEEDIEAIDLAMDLDDIENSQDAVAAVRGMYTIRVARAVPSHVRTIAEHRANPNDRKEPKYPGFPRLDIQFEIIGGSRFDEDVLYRRISVWHMLPNKDRMERDDYMNRNNATRKLALALGIPVKKFMTECAKLDYQASEGSADFLLGIETRVLLEVRTSTQWGDQNEIKEFLPNN